jgi:hypothetical protein
MKTEDLEKLGYGIARGFVTKLWELLAIGIIAVVIFNAARWGLEWGKDDTDPEGKGRSGLTIYTDHGTGVEYLSDGNGLTPRLTESGEISTSR